MAYEAPTITELGSVAELTQSNKTLSLDFDGKFFFFIPLGEKGS